MNHESTAKSLHQSTITQRYPEPDAFGTSASDATTTLGQSSTESMTSEDATGTCLPTVVYRMKRPSTNHSHVVNVPMLINQLMIESATTMALHLSTQREELDALALALIVNPAMLHIATTSHGGLIINILLRLLAADIRGKVLLEVIISDEELIWDLATQTTLQNIYDLADNAWKVRLHNVLIPRFSELCYHPQGNYMISHALRSYPDHHDDELMATASAILSNGSVLIAMCQDKAAVFAAVAWASVVPPTIAQDAVLSLLQHPRASFLFYRLSMSGVAYKVVSALLAQLAHTEQQHLIIMILTKYVRGARYGGKIRHELISRSGIWA
jgi:hypothetical protein